VIPFENLPGDGRGPGEGPDLREVVQRLTTPARAGFVLTKQSLGTTAIRLSLPAGFGERSQMLASMFQAAAELERLPPLIEALQAEARRWEGHYLAWASEYPASRPTWERWRGQLATTQALLHDMLLAATTINASAEPSADQPLPLPLDTQPEYVD
jgi:hypothetical protein